MSPVPEPMHGGRPGPGGGDEEEEFTTPAGLPPGPFLLSSSDEELDNSDQDNAHLGYQPLPQDCEADDGDQEQEVDYSSLSGLMSALATHGPNTIAVDEDERGEATGTQAVGEDRKRDNTSVLTEESAQEWEADVARETAVMWNSNLPAPDRLQLDCGKVEQIKSAMASFTLPQSAIPPWAQNLSDEEWKSQVSSLLGQRDCQ